ncbi:transposase [Streptomyces olivaceoviridis]|uniref:transposase n=1 Tax=Streptomyces olivaceoviridis TaxID=1921 RepID=UPI0036A8B6CB
MARLPCRGPHPSYASLRVQTHRSRVGEPRRLAGGTPSPSHRDHRRLEHGTRGGRCEAGAALRPGGCGPPCSSNRLGGFVVVLLALYLTLERGCSASFAGFVTAVYGVGGAVARSSVAWRGRRWRARGPPGQAGCPCWPGRWDRRTRRRGGYVVAQAAPRQASRRRRTDLEWEFIVRCLPIGRFAPVPRAVTAAVRGVGLAVKTGGRREMPGEFGAWPTVHNRFRQWRDADVLEATWGADR